LLGLIHQRKHLGPELRQGLLQRHRTNSASEAWRKTALKTGPGS
jgi:hypothetical protein